MSMEVDDFVVTSSGPSEPPPSIDAEVASPSASVAVSGDASPDSVSTPEQDSSDDDLTTVATSEPTEPERSPDGKFAKKGSIQERIDKAVGAQRAAERRAAELAAELESYRRSQAPAQAAPAPSLPTYGEGGPQLDQFDSYDAYVDARADWRAEQKLQAYVAQQTAERTQATYNERLNAFVAKTPDFHERMAAWANAGGANYVTDAMRDATLASPRGPEIAYWLATHQSEVVQLAQQTARLGADAAPLVRQLLESKLSPTASSGPVAGGIRPSVPAPIKPVGAAPVVSDPPLDSLDVDDFVARENARERNERKARLNLK